MGPGVHPDGDRAAIAEVESLAEEVIQGLHLHHPLEVAEDQVVAELVNEVRVDELRAFEVRAACSVVTADREAEDTVLESDVDVVAVGQAVEALEGVLTAG